MLIRGGLLALLLVTGCQTILGIDDPTPSSAAVDAGPGDSPDGRTSSCEGSFESQVRRQFVISELIIPRNATEAQQFGLDIDDDPQGRVDNALSQLLATFVSQSGGGDLVDGTQLAVDSGALLLLVNVEEGASCARTDLFEGSDYDVPPDPTDNFSGDESFASETRIGVLTGPRADRMVQPGPGGEVELRLPLFGGATPVTLPLSRARIEYTLSAGGIMDGTLGGAIRADVVDGTVLPGFAETLSQLVENDCTGSAPPCCVDDSAGKTVVDLFDEDDDCKVDLAELRDSSLIAALFSPDIDLYDSSNGNVLAPGVDGIKDSVSFGIGFSGVPASFFVTIDRR